MPVPVFLEIRSSTDISANKHNSIFSCFLFQSCLIEMSYEFMLSWLAACSVYLMDETLSCCTVGILVHHCQQTLFAAYVGDITGGCIAMTVLN